MVLDKQAGAQRMVNRYWQRLEALLLQFGWKSIEQIRRGQSAALMFNSDFPGGRGGNDRRWFAYSDQCVYI